MDVRCRDREAPFGENQSKVAAVRTRRRHSHPELHGARVLSTSPKSARRRASLRRSRLAAVPKGLRPQRLNPTSWLEVYAQSRSLSLGGVAAVWGGSGGQ